MFTECTMLQHALCRKSACQLNNKKFVQIHKYYNYMQLYKMKETIILKPFGNKVHMHAVIENLHACMHAGHVNCVKISSA